MKKLSSLMKKVDMDSFEVLLGKGASIDIIAETLKISKGEVKQLIKEYAVTESLEKKKLKKDAENVRNYLRSKQVSSLSEMAMEFSIKPHEVFDAIEYLKSQGTYIDNNRSGYFISQAPSNQTFNFRTKKGETIAIVADTHFGSKYQQITHLNTAYDMFEDAGVTKVFHLGDLVDGHDVYKGQMWEQFLSGYNDQKNYAIEKYPLRKGITTHIISGNHDDSFYKKNQADIVQDVCESRKDMKYLGRTIATAKFNDRLSIMLVHPKGGQAYAKSYKIQKYVESLISENKPNILALGHYHNAVYLTARNVECLNCCSFQSQTPLAQALGLEPVNGCVMLRVDDVDTTGTIKSFSFTKKQFYVPKENDFGK